MASITQDELARMQHEMERIRQQYAAQASMERSMSDKLKRGALVADILKTLIAARGVSVEMAGLDEAIVDQAFRYADLIIGRLEKDEYEQGRKAAQAMAKPFGMAAAQSSAKFAAASGLKNSPMGYSPIGGGGAGSL